MIEYQFYNPGGSEADQIERPNCCLDPHPRLVFLGRDEWILDCTHCESNLVAIKTTEPVVGGQPEDLDDGNPLYDDEPLSDHDRAVFYAETGKLPDED